MQSAEAKPAASMPLNLGGMGLRDAVREAVPAYWASWADCMPMIFNRHPPVANLFVHELEGAPEGALGAAAEARRAMIGVWGFDPPIWEDLVHGARPPPAEPEKIEIWSGRGWQHEAASRVEFQHMEELFTHMTPSHRAQVRSQAGPGAGMALSAAPTHFLTRCLLTCSVSCCCDVSGFLCLFRCTHAGVAAKSTSLATTEHRVHEQAYWDEKGTRWKVQQQESAWRRAGESPPT